MNLIQLLSVLVLCGLLLCAESLLLCPTLGKAYVSECLQLHTSLQSATNSGLLGAISDVSSALFYSPKISLPQAAALAKNKSLLYEIVKADCNNDEKEIDRYLDEIKRKLKEFMEKNEVFNREDLKRGLKMVTEDKGNFACLLGGKSTGKSLVLNAFSREEVKNRKVVYVDLRDGYSSITHGFVEVITKSKNAAWRDILWAFLKKGLQSKVKVSGEIELDFSSFLDVLRTEKEPISILKSLLEDLTSNAPNEVITLIVDEANLALTINQDTSVTDVKQVKAALSLFTRLTKQEKKINVILVSSEHIFPFRLADPKLGFNLDDINEFFFAGEIPPNEMLKLLTTEWRLTDKLALALINLYGGHLYDIYLALIRLRKSKTRFTPFDADRSAGIAKCFKEDTDNKLLVNTLKLLGETGFAPVKDRDDPVAEVLSKHNVAGVVKLTSLNVGLPDNVWDDGFKYGLVPSRQSTRLLIAEYLIENKHI